MQLLFKYDLVKYDIVKDEPVKDQYGFCRRVDKGKVGIQIHFLFFPFKLERFEQVFVLILNFCYS